MDHLEYHYTVLDVVHIGKCCKGSFSNWWLIVDGYRINLSMLCCLRQDFNLDQSAKLRKAIPLEAVRHKDKMATESVPKICSPRCKLALSKIRDKHGHAVVYNVFPWFSVPGRLPIFEVFGGALIKTYEHLDLPFPAHTRTLFTIYDN